MLPPNPEQKGLFFFLINRRRRRIGRKIYNMFYSVTGKFKKILFI